MNKETWKWQLFVLFISVAVSCVLRARINKAATLGERRPVRAAVSFFLLRAERRQLTHHTRFVLFRLPTSSAGQLDDPYETLGPSPGGHPSTFSILVNINDV